VKATYDKNAMRLAWSASCEFNRYYELAVISGQPEYGCRAKDIVNPVGTRYMLQVTMDGEDTPFIINRVGNPVNINTVTYSHWNLFERFEDKAMDITIDMFLSAFSPNQNQLLDMYI